MSNDRNKDLIRSLFENCYSGDYERFDSLVSNDYVDHAKWKDKSGLMQTIKVMLATYPDLTFKIEDMVGEGDKIAARVTASATAMGEKGTASALVLFRIENGKIAEHWGHADRFF